MRNLTLIRWLAAAAISLSSSMDPIVARAVESPHVSLTPEDEAAIRATMESYRIAWLANDSKGVLKSGVRAGIGWVAWTVTERGATRRHSQPGTYLNVMKKLPDGSWRIQARMWDDGLERVD